MNNKTIKNFFKCYWGRSWLYREFAARLSGE
jgi:hypothetical protein